MRLRLFADLFMAVPDLKPREIIYTMSVPTNQTHGGNFVKSQPIFKLLLPLEREGNFQYNPRLSSNHTLSMVRPLEI